MHPLAFRSRRVRQVALWLLLAAAGCGSGQYPVSGKVTLEDGSPLSKGMVVFERKEGGEPITARGDIQADGSYQLSTHKPGDGVPAGKYRVLVYPRLNIDSPTPERDRPFDARYSDFSTSGLECEVKPGANEYPIQVARPGKRLR
jgi:hypothetical protein